MNLKQSKISLSPTVLFVMVTLALIVTGAMTYARFFIIGNFEVTAEAECDPETDSCFVYHCDPDMDECSMIPSENVWYYKLITRPANTPVDCGPESPCFNYPCLEGETGCEETLCDPIDGEECIGPIPSVGAELSPEVYIPDVPGNTDTTNIDKDVN